ncbi:MAG: hypothetical protein IJ257_09020 [Treponema sp.]|nr:hypothetical protein [Treponema sp.]
MKKIFLTFMTLVFCNLLFAKQNIDDTISAVSKDIADRCDKREIIAILDFRSDSAEMSEYLSSQLTSMIFENSTLQVVTRQHMDKVERELKFMNSGLVSDSTALSIGERLGAKKITFGSLDELDNKYTLEVKMLDVETGSYALFKKYEISRSSKTEQLLHHAATIYKSSLGFIAEANKNSISHVSPAAGISFDYSLIRRLSLGVKALVSFDALEKDNTIYTIEPLGFLRWYVTSPTGEPSAGLFVEGQGGAEVVLVNDEIKTAVSSGLSLGFRITAGNFYFEPALRGGYPYLFGAGLGAGFRF